MKLSDLPHHHAILITHPDRRTYSAGLWMELSDLSPAHTFFDQTVLDIETARKIISWAQTPYNEERIALISFHTAGIPAQNAMLKILEEPRPGVRFILLTSNPEHLLPTVISRVHKVGPTEDRKSQVESSHAEEFLRTSHAFRMKLSFVGELLARTDEEGRKDREGVRTFILSVAASLSVAQVSPRRVQETLELASYAADPSSSGRALLEYLSLLVPHTK